MKKEDRDILLRSFFSVTVIVARMILMLNITLGIAKLFTSEVYIIIVAVITSLYVAVDMGFNLLYLARSNLSMKDTVICVILGGIVLWMKYYLYNTEYYKRNGYLIPTRSNREKKLLKILKT